MPDYAFFLMCLYAPWSFFDTRKVNMTTVCSTIEITLYPVINILPLHTGNTPKLTLSNLFASEICTFLTRHNDQNDEKSIFKDHKDMVRQ